MPNKRRSRSRLGGPFLPVRRRRTDPMVKAAMGDIRGPPPGWPLAERVLVSKFRLRVRLRRPGAPTWVFGNKPRKEG